MVAYRVSALAALAMLSGQAIAQPVEHHLHRREPVNVFVTVQETHYVTAGHDVAPSGVAQVASTFSYVADAGTTVVPAVASPSTSAPVQVSLPSIPKETSAAPAPVSSSSSSSGSGSGVSVGSAGALGVTYTPYTSGGQCKTSGEVASDLAKLSGYSIIRLYGTDCDQVANVYKAKAAGQKLFLGVFDMGNIAGSISDMDSGLGGDWSDVHTVSIGNELVNAGTASVGQVSGFVQQGRDALKKTSYSGPVVAVDTFIATINNPGLCAISDYVAINAHAFFDGGVDAAGAGKWALQQIQRVYDACGGSKSVMITESGWPSQGGTNGLAVPSVENQQTAIQALKSSVGNDCLLFTAFNDFWKAPGAFNAEQYWGIYGDASA